MAAVGAHPPLILTFSPRAGRRDARPPLGGETPGLRERRLADPRRGFIIGRMTDDEIVALAGWIAQAGLAGASETRLMQGFCERAAAAGLPLARGIAFIDTLHPLHEGRSFRWERDKPDVTFTDYGRSTRRAKPPSAGGRAPGSGC